MSCFGINERFQTARKYKKVSRAKVAEQMGVSEGVLANIELKRVEEVKDLYIHLFCAALNINEHWLRTGEGQIHDKSEDDKLIQMAVDVAKLDDEKTREAIHIFLALEEPFLSIARDMIISLKKHSTQ